MLASVFLAVVDDEAGVRFSREDVNPPAHTSAPKHPLWPGLPVEIPMNFRCTKRKGELIMTRKEAIEIISKARIGQQRKDDIIKRL